MFRRACGQRIRSVGAAACALLLAAAAGGELRLVEVPSRATDRTASVGGELRLEVRKATTAEKARGGELALRAAAGEGGVCGCLQTIFTDGFESGDLSAWSSSSP